MYGISEAIGEAGTHLLSKTHRKLDKADETQGKRKNSTKHVGVSARMVHVR